MSRMQKYDWVTFRSRSVRFPACSLRATRTEVVGYNSMDVGVQNCGLWYAVCGMQGMEKDMQLQIGAKRVRENVVAHKSSFLEWASVHVIPSFAHVSSHSWMNKCYFQRDQGLLAFRRPIGNERGWTLWWLRLTKPPTDRPTAGMFEPGRGEGVLDCF
ncbi:hypothetical protein FRB91_003179 [Serendipita sp. 411]|nr:hypothetical protein FRB91_003179 [Serendipita sp. 411]